MDSEHTSGLKPNGVGVDVLCGCGERRWLGGNAPRNHGSSLLNGFQAASRGIFNARARACPEMLRRGDRRTLTTKQVPETEAEAVAFVVCKAIGIET